MAQDPLAAALELSVAERIQLVEDIWDSIPVRQQLPPLTQAQRDELDRRLEDLRQNPGDQSTWEDVKSRILDGR